MLVTGTTTRAARPWYLPTYHIDHLQVIYKDELKDLHLKQFKIGFITDYNNILKVGSSNIHLYKALSDKDTYYN